MNLLGKIRRLHYRDALSISEIARRTGLSRNTVKRWLKAGEGAEPKYRRKTPDTALTPYLPRLHQWLEADARRAKRDRRTALKLYAELQALGYSGSYSRVTEHIRHWREAGGAAKPAFVPLKFAAGEAFQFDWSEETLMIGGQIRKVLAAHTKLCASKAFLVSAYPAQSHEMLFDAHTRAFRAFGGIPRRGIYDNMKTAVDKVGVGKRRIVNTRFSAMAAHYLFDPDFCNVASGWEKQLSFESSGMNRIVPIFTGSDHGVEDGQKLAHASDDSDLFGFSDADEAIVEVLDDAVESNCGQGGHVKTAPHLPATAENCAFAAHLPRVAIEGRDADQGTYFAAGQAAQLGDIGNQCRDRGRADATYAGQTLCEIGVVRLDVFGQFRLDLVKLRADRLDDRLDTFSRNGMADRKPLMLCDMHDH